MEVRRADAYRRMVFEEGPRVAAQQDGLGGVLTQMAWVGLECVGRGRRAGEWHLIGARLLRA